MWVPVPMGPERTSDSHGPGIVGNCELFNMGAENWTQERQSLLATDSAPAPRNPFQNHICQDSTPNHRFFVMYVWVWKYVVWGLFCKILKLLSSFLRIGPILCMLGNSSTIEISMFFETVLLNCRGQPWACDLPTTASWVSGIIGLYSKAWLKLPVSTLLKEPLLYFWLKSLEWPEARVACLFVLVVRLVTSFVGVGSSSAHWGNGSKLCRKLHTVCF